MYTMGSLDSVKLLFPRIRMLAPLPTDPFWGIIMTPGAWALSASLQVDGRHFLDGRRDVQTRYVVADGTPLCSAGRPGHDDLVERKGYLSHVEILLDGLTATDRNLCLLRPVPDAGHGQRVGARRHVLE